MEFAGGCGYAVDSIEEFTEALPDWTLVTQEGRPTVRASDLEDVVRTETADEKVAAINTLLARLSLPTVPPLVIVPDA